MTNTHDPRLESAEDFADWPCDLIATLMFCRDGDEVLLIHKKRGLGAGKINGPGGKLDPGETLADCACRETREETGIAPLAPVDAGALCFSFADGLRLRVHPFVSEAHRGELHESDEATPFWQRVDDMPYARMWADDRLWLPHVLAGGRAYGHFHFDGDALLSHHLLLL